MEITNLDLLKRITDVRMLSVPPLPGEQSGCASSHDRLSRYIAQENRYVVWDANDDGGGYERRLEDGGVVALQLEGPGVIWRSWSAMPGEGNIRVYVDGERILDVPFIRYFTHFGEDYAPRNLPDLCPRISRGYNSFLPIPFQKTIRVELAPGWGRYYHFTYSLFPVETRMPRFDGMFKRPLLMELAALDRKLHFRGMHGFTPKMRIQIPAKGNARGFEASNGGAIERLQMRLSDPEQAHKLLIQMYWDGEAEPSVCVPLCDFFAAPKEMNPFATWLSGYVGGVFYSRWYMPFAKGARIEILNLGGEATTVEMDVAAGECPDAESRLRFRAKWHRDCYPGLDEKEFLPGGQRYPDWPVLRASGRPGRFCGMHLRILDTWRYPDGMKRGEWWFSYDGSKRVDWWWGEGDEKFFVDGEKFPSTFGTGSEDYVGYAWAAEPPFALFDSPFAANGAMPLDGNGVTSVCRFHVCDNVPFQQSFDGFIEKYKGNEWGNGGRCLYGATAFWYQAAGAADPYGRPTLQETEELT